MIKGSKQTPEAIEKNRLAHLGKKDDPETLERKRLSHLVEKNAFYGKHHSEETLKKITGRPKSAEHCKKLSEAKKGKVPANIELFKASRIGLTNSKEHRRIVSEALTGLVRSEETKQKISENRAGVCMGSDNAAWNGGTSYFPYCPKFNDRRKRAVRKFFGNYCVLCGKSKEDNIVANKEYALSVHHIDHDKEQGCNGKPFNLVPLCFYCHEHEQFDKEGYRIRINKILEEGFVSGRWNREQYIHDVMYLE
jgi:hypothetical protein